MYGEKCSVRAERKFRLQDTFRAYRPEELLTDSVGRSIACRCLLRVYASMRVSIRCLPNNTKKYNNEKKKKKKKHSFLTVRQSTPIIAQRLATVIAHTTTRNAEPTKTAPHAPKTPNTASIVVCW